jgi:cell division transport system permease protein
VTRALFAALLRGARGMRRNPLIQLTAVGTIALSLLLVGVVLLAASNVARLAESWGQGVQLVVYLEDGASPARQKQIAAALAKLPGVDSVRAVEPREAWERMRKSLGDRGELLDGVEESFLPASIEAQLKPGVAEVMRAHPAFEKLRKTAGVEEVQLLDDWSARLRALEEFLRVAGLGVGLLVLCACLYIVGSTIRLGVFARKDEIEIQKLVGATDGFVKAPFLVEGALQGGLGAAGALLLLWGLWQLTRPGVESLLGNFLASAPLAFFSTGAVLAGVAGGALLGLCGSAMALGRYVDV